MMNRDFRAPQVPGPLRELLNDLIDLADCP
jgi:hypothetical protein